MQPSKRALSIFGLALAAACAAPSAELASSPARDDSAASFMRFRFLDHLSFGARIEHISILLDGVSAYEGEASRGDARVQVRPGTHTLAVVLRASEPCGLFDEPRTSVAVEATTSIHAGEGPASVLIDLLGTEATSDPLHSLAVRFTGDQVVLGNSLVDSPASGCDPADALCAVDALGDRARAKNDAEGAACYAAKRAEIRGLKDVVEDSYATVKREGTTTGAAESAQLRARYAEERIRAIAVSAGTCEAHGRHALTVGVVERKVERVCPGRDVTAGLDRFWR